MLFEIMMQDSRAEGLAEGLVKGKEAGITEGRDTTLTELMRKMILAGNTDKKILSLLTVTQEQIEKERKMLVKPEA